MKRCLSERTLLRVHGSDGTVAEREHLRFCADCAERYDRFEEDLDSLRRILDTPPLAASVRHTHAVRLRWMPIAATAAALVAVLVGVRAFRQPGALPVARRSAAVAAFAADVSAALFPESAPTTVALATNDTSYLQAALDAGALCTRERYLNGACNDQLSALLFEGE
jgi:hypothetical protein